MARAATDGFSVTVSDWLLGPIFSGKSIVNSAVCVFCFLPPRMAPPLATIFLAPHGTIGLVSLIASDSLTPRARASMVTSPGASAVVWKSRRTCPPAGTVTSNSSAFL